MFQVARGAVRPDRGAARPARHDRFARRHRAPGRAAEAICACERRSHTRIQARPALGHSRDRPQHQALPDLLRRAPHHRRHDRSAPPARARCARYSVGCDRDRRDPGDHPAQPSPAERARRRSAPSSPTAAAAVAGNCGLPRSARRSCGGAMCRRSFPRSGYPPAPTDCRRRRRSPPMIESRSYCVMGASLRPSRSPSRAATSSVPSMRRGCGASSGTARRRTWTSARRAICSSNCKGSIGSFPSQSSAAPAHAKRSPEMPSALPLSGLVVVEIGTSVAGLFAGQIPPISVPT